ASQPMSEAKAPSSQLAPPHHAAAPTDDPAPKPTDVPSEQPAPEQLAVLKDKDKTGAVTLHPTTKRYYRVTVRDGGTLQSGKLVIQLAGIVARDADATCKDDQ